MNIPCEFRSGGIGSPKVLGLWNGFLHFWGWMVGLLIVARLGAAEYSIAPLGFGTISGSSSAQGFVVEGNLSVLPVHESLGGSYTLTGGVEMVEDVTRVTGFGLNLLPFGDAEGIVPSEIPLESLPGWVVEGQLLVTRWGTPGGWPLETDPGPTDRGTNFFAGGEESPMAKAWYRGTIPIPPEIVDSGRVVVELSGWFGGFQGQADTALLAAQLFDDNGEVLESLHIGGVTAEMRTNRTGVIYDGLRRSVPVGARGVEVLLTLQRSAPLGWNDGYADNLKLVFLEPPAASIQMTAALQPGLGIELTFPTEVGRTYSLQAIDTVDMPAWESVPGTERMGTGGNLSYTLPADGGPARRFFRLRVSP